MTRTNAQMANPQSFLPNYEWGFTFRDCTNLTMGSAFTFDPVKWASVTTIGHNFALEMFNGCSGSFTMNDVFNLPQGITQVGYAFVNAMFANCYGDAFTMNDVFNLPQGITQEGDNFAGGMFVNCYGDAFTMNDIFNLPQDITQVGFNFAISLFLNCNGASFTMNDVFNLPQGITQTGGGFAGSVFDGCNGDAFTMNDVFNLPQNLTQASEEFAYSIFEGCSGASFTMNETFNLPQGITQVGLSFASRMFYGCNGDAFTMNDVFHLPPGITQVSDSFVDSMFYGCNGASFTMNETFNLPQGITQAGNRFAFNMFAYCYRATFTMNETFNLPQGISSVGDWFAYDIFGNCYGASFTMNETFNLPQGISSVGNGFAWSLFNGAGGPSFQVNDVFRFPVLTQASVDALYTYDKSLALNSQTPIQRRTALSIINGNPTPSSEKDTFKDDEGIFSDWQIVPLNWGGGGLSNPSRSLAIATVPAQAYTGAQITPTPRVTDAVDGTVLSEGTDYTLSYGQNTTVAQGGTVTATGAGAYADASATAAFEILRAPAPHIAWPDAAAITYGQPLGAAALDPAANAYGSFAWEAPARIPGAGTSAWPAVFTPNAETLANYEPISPSTAQVSVTVSKALVNGIGRTLEVAQGYASAYTFDLASLLPQVAGLTGVKYSVATISDPSELLASPPSGALSTPLLPLRVNAVSGVGVNAIVGITVASDNYVTFTANITVVTVAKAQVSINGVSSSGAAYNKQAHTGYTGTPTFIVLPSGQAVAPTYTISYSGRDGTVYSETSAPIAAGAYTVTIRVTDTEPYTGSATIDFTITPALLTATTGDFAAAKVYDGTLARGVTSGSLGLIGVLAGDGVGLVAALDAYPQKNIGTYTILAALTLSGADAINYQLTSSTLTGIRASITPRQLSWATAGTVLNRVYNGTTSAAIATLPQLANVVQGDNVVAIPGRATFASAGPGNSIGVVATGFTIRGADIANYLLPSSQPPFNPARITSSSQGTGGSNNGTSATDDRDENNTANNSDDTSDTNNANTNNTSTNSPEDDDDDTLTTIDDTDTPLSHNEGIETGANSLFWSILAILVAAAAVFLFILWIKRRKKNQDENN